MSKSKYQKEQEAKKKQRATQAFREGRGRIKEDSSAKREARGVGRGLGTGGEGRVAGSSGTRGIRSTRGGSTIRVVTEKKASTIKKKGLVDKSPKLKRTGRLVKKEDGTLSSTTRPKAKSVIVKKKKEAAKNKPPLNYGAPMNYSMQPGSRETDSPGAFRDTLINKYMGAPVNYGTESPTNDGHDKKKAALEKARKAREEFQSKNPGAKLNVKTKQPVKPKTELKTTVKGDLSSGGYSDAQKKKAIAQMKADAAKKKKGIK